eukprot:CAMPEP_0113708738 /NCGR_PEP_ID=MMETSP0038_2-20120614/29159_1 /TAXON_ID=2898 /ORGANISM="Cryptomonas paramecium" /LENGTH=126 /DNA_ID=CAMNT_0000634499 /DNA_START=267 /DNA_END=643 /DNA_ORIENTATION=+ /assembly_acc=CAM_ASM_000170
MPISECSDCLKSGGKAAECCATLRRCQLDIRIVDMCCSCIRKHQLKGVATLHILSNLKSGDDFLWLRDSCVNCRAQRRVLCTPDGLFRRTNFSSLCICGLAEEDHPQSLSSLSAAPASTSPTLQPR